MAEAVAAAMAVPPAIVALKQILHEVRGLDDLQNTVDESLDRLGVEIEVCDRLLADDELWRQHKVRQRIRADMGTKMEEAKSYLHRAAKKMATIRTEDHIRRNFFRVRRVSGKAKKFSLSLLVLRTKLEGATGFALVWLDSASPVESGGAQYSFRAPVGLCDDARANELRSVVVSSHQSDILFVQGQPGVGKSALCSTVLASWKSELRPTYPDGCIHFPMQSGEMEADEFATIVGDYLDKCIPTHCTGFIPPKRPGTSSLLQQVVAFFEPVVSSRQCIFLVDEYWPRRRGRGGVRWNHDPLLEVMKLSSLRSLVLVCTSNRRALLPGSSFAVETGPTANIRTVHVPTAQRSLMENLFVRGWNSELDSAARIDEMTDLAREVESGWLLAAERILDACGGLPSSARLAGKALCQRKIAGSALSSVMGDVERGLSQAMHPGFDLPEAVKSIAVRAVKFCEDSLDEAHSPYMSFYKRLGKSQPCLTTARITNWANGENGFVVAISIADAVAKEGSSFMDWIRIMYARFSSDISSQEDVATLIRGINELNKYLPICVSTDGTKVLMCPLIHEYARQLP